MNLKNVFPYIHYCNSRSPNDPRKLRSLITRTLQHHELILVTGGKGRFIVDNRSHTVQEGTLCYIRPDVLHTIEVDAREPISCLTVHFSYANIRYDDGAWSVGNEVHSLSLQDAQMLKNGYQIADTFKKLVDSWDSKRPGYELISKAYLLQLLFEISQYRQKQNENHAVSLKIEKVIEYMHLHIGQRVTLGELAELVHLSTYYLSRAFKNTTGYSVIEYFNKIKVDKAKELLAEEDKKVKEVARELGFADEFYFSRIFKRMEGISPSEYHGKIVHGL
ncbi:MAG: AraC family transcriptional regulator [Paenibacillus macerans]|uniref:Helix-turn-helix domain protein n=1 Tax=Paenibacillus macerans TaxID=44252 RepID=A0A090ZWC7_PAEMA|nr:AraC family transcriptional regulator [Paenibacillus macerans]KFN08451.1 helix-turn-helix domain protein [Paenibacillus macerans]MBS5913892.1 helix-turn-helix transcriptional regulator [Paenibacillus macerans]MCY7561903.1 AraC family transcriptional regulator [Paenibacillus macerans]MDU7474059.1 AraC family transcriptional regulator [Paenibacillus macerans]MEC0136173.1 AraC family transcriptional regulator [Paenibacillus macerans]